MLRRCLTRFAGVGALPGNVGLAEHDPEIFGILNAEQKRQGAGLELIASENFTSRAVMECLGSFATNKYAEGLPGARYYGGTEQIDKIERLCQKRALEVYDLDPNEWGVNVQPYSGSPANFAAFTGLLKPHDRLMGLHLPAGGHLTHGFYTPMKKISASSVYFESLPYGLDKEGRIDYDGLEQSAKVYLPNLIIAGGSAYTRDWDYARYRSIADDVKAFFMVDMAHYSGLVATKEHKSPFEYADVVTTTTHKTLRGPRSGMIFYRKAVRDPRSTETINLNERINQAVFPALQGGPHMHQIAAVATQLKEVASPEFKEYIKAVKANAKALADELMQRGNTLISNGTDNHLLLWDLRPQKITGSKVERALQAMDITCNKNSVVGDKSAMTPGGVRLGTPALTTRGLSEDDFREVGKLLNEGLKIAQLVQSKVPGGSKKLVDFERHLGSAPQVAEHRKKVEAFAAQFPMPGREDPFAHKKV